MYWFRDGSPLVRPYGHTICSFFASEVSSRSKSMMQGKLIRGVIGLAFGLVMLLIPISSGAQTGGILGGAKKGVQQGADTVQKGVEKGAHETKEGAEAVGRGTKKAITGEDNNPDQSRMKSESQSQTESTQTESTRTQSKATGKRNLPKTAGELPLLALAGCLALAGAAASGLRRRREN
jgi:LPXTG-motif cell wall-anchored protein